MAQKFVKFTEEEKNRANHTDIAELLAHRGETIRRVGDEKLWNNGEHDVWINNNCWYDHYTGSGGGPIAFFMEYFRASYIESMNILLDRPVTLTSKEDKELIIPEFYENTNRVKNYLTVYRKIDEDIVDFFIRQKAIAESADYHNALFIGYDNDNNPRHISIRGIGKNSTFKKSAANSQAEYSFHYEGGDNTLYVFESAIDLMSYICIFKEGWEKHNYSASTGVGYSNIYRMLYNNPNINEIYICFDNDTAGNEAFNRIDDRLFVTTGKSAKRLLPQYKDWNEDLVIIKDIISKE